MPESCAVCHERNLEPIVELPALPLTDTLCHTPSSAQLRTVDQALMHCAACGHLQLATFLEPNLLYGANYRFRSGDSATGRMGVAFFLKFLDRVTSRRRYRVAVDVGCNDLHCLIALETRAAKRIGVDPIWTDPSQLPDPDITVIGKTVEETDWRFLDGTVADLIVCRHTLEHVRDPASAVRQFIQHLSEDGMLVIEIPGVEALLSNLRFDHVFHQHLHYFSRMIMHRLIQEAGGEIVAESENWRNWGAQLIAARKRQSAVGECADGPMPCIAEIGRRYAAFRKQMDTSAELLDLLKDRIPIVGYGAGQMLPVLAWHLGTDLGFLDGVLDDDEKKDGLRYANLPLNVRQPHGPADWQDQAVMITAVDHAHAILRRLQPALPRHVVHPLCFL